MNDILDLNIVMRDDISHVKIFPSELLYRLETRTTKSCFSGAKTVSGYYVYGSFIKEDEIEICHRRKLSEYGDIWSPDSVTVWYKSGGDSTRYFDSYKEALEYYSRIEKELQPEVISI